MKNEENYRPANIEFDIVANEEIKENRKMKSEFTIGNLIKFKSSDKIAIVWSIQELDDGEILVNNISISNVEPIKLTDDLLIKSGFKKVGLYYKKEDCFIIGWKSIDGNEIWVGVNRGYSKNYKNIHELQNLYFTITGKELKIKL